MSELALFGGKKAVQTDPGDMFDWPIITKEDEEAVLDVLRQRAMSGRSLTIEFEEEYADWMGTEYALGFHNGTASIQAALYGCGVGVGDEVICPSVTYWASTIPVFSLGATVVFADIDPETVCLDPEDIEKKVTDRTKAIIVVDNYGHPADMDGIMEVARKHDLKVIEDVSHAQGGLYKGKMLGTIGDVGAMSLMSGKSLAVGEAGIFVTDDVEIYERAIAFGHYARHSSIGEFKTKELNKYKNLPLGGYKYRMHQMSAAVGKVQLKYYDERCKEIRKAMNYFWDLLEDVPGIKAHRPDHPESTMGGWYAPMGLYRPEELEGLSITRFTEAVREEGVSVCTPGCNIPLHSHRMFQDADIYGHGKPTRIANSNKDVREFDKELPESDRISSRIYTIPWFKHYRPEVIEEYAAAFKKAAENYKELLKDDPGNPETLGAYSSFNSSV